MVPNVLSAAGAPPGTFPVIDPFSKKLFIPMKSMIDTRAMHREGVPSLCRIFLQGRCRQDARCFQAHADNDTVLRLRAAALAEPSCCPVHGAPSASSELPESLQLVVNSDHGTILGRLPLSQVCVTNGLRTLLVAQGVTASCASPEVVLPVSALCRLHGGHGGSPCCRFGEECNFVHICRERSKEMESNKNNGAAVVPPYPAPVAVHVPHDNGVPAVAEVCKVLHTPTSQQRPPILLSAGVTGPRQMSGPLMDPSAAMPMSASVGYSGTPPLNFDPLGLAATAPTRNKAVVTYPMGMSPVRSFSSTPNGLVWRHNPYGSSKASSVIET